MLKVDPDSHVQCPGCLGQVDCFGDHLLCCHRNNYTRRHQAVQGAIVSVVSDAAQPHAREVPIPDCPEGQLRPADILLKGWQTGTGGRFDGHTCMAAIRTGVHGQ